MAEKTTKLSQNPPVAPFPEAAGELLLQKTQNIPGSVQYSRARYRLLPGRDVRDSGRLEYRYRKEELQGNYLDLVYCFSADGYCHKGDEGCAGCPYLEDRPASGNGNILEMATFRFTPDHLWQFVKKVRTSSFSESIVSFSHNASFSRELPLCERTRKVLGDLVNHSLDGDLENIFVNAQAQMLLLYSMECLGGPGCQADCWKFLENEEGKEKIRMARRILLHHLTEPLTIKELSRRVAINECYLKKGFRELFGTTIFDFFQSQRMEHARYLLYEKGMGVTEVSNVLGYSSISHFSTAFKKHTGLKPCALLLR